MNGKKIAALGLAVVLGISVSACSKEEETEAVNKISVEVQNPRVGSLELDRTYIGSVTPQEQVYVMPMTSGTVTDVFFSVGDMVQEGDVLFKIDDEAAKLQLENAQAAYSAAQAGVTAQNSGARDLQNYQTEQQIRQLQKSLIETDQQIEDMEDDLDDLENSQGGLNAALAQAQQTLAAAQADYNKKVADKPAELEKKKLELQGLSGSEKQAEDAKRLSEEITNLQKEIAGIAAETGYTAAQAAVDQVKAGISANEAYKTQLKSGIDQLEDGRDTLEDNFHAAQESYAITQNEVYPQSDAASAAQLSQAAVGIDSAKMQLDFCTVESPITGVVESVSVEKNGMAAAGNPAFIISNKESMTVTFQVTEQAKNVLKAGDHVTVDRSGEQFDGVITEVGTMANPQTRMFVVKASVSGAGDRLPNGVSVKVSAVAEREDDKLIVPYDMIYFSAGDAYVYCVQEDNTLIRQAVTVGLMNDTEAVIEEGLTADSVVVKNWSSRFRDGAEVEIVSETEEDAPAEETPAAEPDPAQTEPSEEAE